jgi:hypothetical protein
VNGGQCLIAWENVCKPTDMGGLGVKDLKLQGLALRARWEWLRRTDPDRPWQGLPTMRDSAAHQVFQSCAKIQIGNGLHILFCMDRWINGFTAAEIAPLAAEHVNTRTRTKRTTAEGLLDQSWVEDVQGPISLEGCAQCARLWVILNGLRRNVQEVDTFIWAGSDSGGYSAKATYKRLCEGNMRFSMATPIWKSFAPLKCKIFGWLAVQYRLWTSDRRHRHGLQDHHESCFTCLQETDSVDHILVRCSYAKMVWWGGLQRARMTIQEPQGDTTLEEWWSRSRKLVAKSNRRKFDTLVILMAWMLWKQRNARVFGNTRDQCASGQLIDRIHDEFQLWESARAGGRHQRARE